MEIEKISAGFAMKLADIVISEIMEPEYEDSVKLKYSRLRLPIALRFIDLDKFKIIKPINVRVYDVGFIARLEQEKGVLEFLCAIKLLHMEGYRSRVLVGGSGSLLRYIKRFFSENKIDARILDYIPHSEIPRVLNEIKILVLPSKKEGVPTILLEALASGVIPVASKVGGIPWLFNTAQTGMLLDIPSCNSVYNALKSLLNLPLNELSEISRKGRLFAEKYLGLDRAISRYRVLKAVTD
jgi:glycosyltransferase involved in cell wall biosynthesis